MSTLKDDVVKLAFDNPGPVRDALLPVLKQADQAANWTKIFESLKYGQSIQVAFTSFNMSHGNVEDGKFHEWKVGRRSRSKRSGMEAVTLMPLDGSKSRFPYRLYRYGADGDVGASSGDMAMNLKGLKL